jgi:formylglycine-generating enzyme required for sulfatase activity
MRDSVFLRVVGRVGCAAVLCTVTAIADDARSPSFVGAKAGQLRDDNGLKMKLVWCPPGKFAMGSPKDEKGRHRDEEDQVQVTLTRGFWLGQHEVTQSEWRQVMQTAPWSGEDYVKEGDNYPATYVNWAYAISFCEKLSEQERSAGRLPSGWHYTLPTEAQWEYACRAGTTTRYGFGDAESDLPEYAWIEKNAKAAGEEYAHQVGQKKANGFGLHDMHGNVMEWCRDWYSDKLPGGTDPVVKAGQATDLGEGLAAKAPATGGAARVFRGGNWFSGGGFCRSAARGKRTPGFRLFNLGFRVALERSVH